MQFLQVQSASNFSIFLAVVQSFGVTGISAALHAYFQLEEKQNATLIHPSSGTQTITESTYLMNYKYRPEYVTLVK